MVSHAGATLLRLLADRAGLTGALSAGLARAGWWPVHDRGRVLVDLAVMIADGGDVIADIDVLRHQQEVFGSVASDTTAWRAWTRSAWCSCGESPRPGTRYTLAGMVQGTRPRRPRLRLPDLMRLAPQAVS
ncbi:hypothetical protein [Micromonospora sp. NPDC047738]|uniref:hypothetical protein n=1 Tax=unclassified Micromonospora TaxID=2617518 RepID=UPI0033EA8EC7